MHGSFDKLENIPKNSLVYLFRCRFCCLSLHFQVISWKQPSASPGYEFGILRRRRFFGIPRRSSHRKQMGYSYHGCSSSSPADWWEMRNCSGIQLCNLRSIQPLPAAVIWRSGTRKPKWEEDWNWDNENWAKTELNVHWGTRKDVHRKQPLMYLQSYKWIKM